MSDDQPPEQGLPETTPPPEATPIPPPLAQPSTMNTALDVENLIIPTIDRIVVSRKTIIKADWRNRRFTDLNGLKAIFENCDFRYSIFERSYFRDAQFKNCQFEGTKFIDCNFKSAKFYKCDLKFAHFQRSLLDVREVLSSLPTEPNIRREGLQNLRVNANEVGESSSGGLLVLQEIEAEKLHYYYALKGYDHYYREKYPTILARFEAGLRLGWLQFEGLIWGHGERPWRLLFSCFSIMCALTLVNFWSVMPRLGWNQCHGGLDIARYVVRLFLDMSLDPRFRGFAATDYIIVLMRYVYIGLFISVLYKSISHR